MRPVPRKRGTPEMEAFFKRVEDGELDGAIPELLALFSERLYELRRLEGE